ncbi:MAG: hypothetical protein AAGI90_01455 [Chlamydiota bacterium]
MKQTSKNALAALCSTIRKETIEPAQSEATEILDNARVEREQILQGAREKSRKITQETEEKLAKIEKSFQASLESAMSQAIDTLKQTIEKDLFEPAISSLFTKELHDPKLLAKLIEAVASAIESEGLEPDLELFVTKEVDKKKLLGALVGNIKKRLSEEKIQELPLQEGIALKLEGEGLTIDLTRPALEAFLRNFLGSAFNDLIFQKTP